MDATAQFYSAAFEQTPAAMMAIDDTGRVHAANAAACRLHCVDRYELVGLRIQELLPAELDLDKFIQTLRMKGDASIDFHEAGQSGGTTSTRLEARRFRPHRYIVILHDVTWEKTLEKALARAHERDTMSSSAASILHDVNNLLAPILAYSDALLGRGPVDEEMARMLGELRTAAERAATLARKLLSLGQASKDWPVFLQLNDVIEQSAEMLKRVAGERVELLLKLDPELGVVKVDREYLERVLLNLVLNARDAMPNGGVLTIQTANRVSADSLRLGFASSRANAERRFATLSVSDTGVGMDAPTRARIFEPFFTTKPPGAGTGLGLSSALSFVHRSGGFIDVESEPGHGTTIRIALPQVGSIAKA
jgi:PAS domain S-box-containing protein